jgi:hypothetical protein|nr:MAG TPA: protein of unknown function (DUF4083) [Bacteriophage sp.]
MLQEPSILSQLLGVATIIIFVAIAYAYVLRQDKLEADAKKKKQELEEKLLELSEELYEAGRYDESQAIRKNIRRKFQGFTFDNEKPEGLRPEPLALPAPIIKEV